MEWNNDDREALITFTKSIDSDDIKIKEQIKLSLLNNRFICHALYNEEIESDEDSSPSDYFGVNILPYYFLPTAQTDVKNFICYEVSFDELQNNNRAIKVMNIKFYILCKYHNMVDPETGIARHDLLAALLQYEFNNKTYFGRRIHLVSDTPSTTDTAYATRTLVFEQITDNAIVRSNYDKENKKNIPRIANKDIQEYKELV